MLGLLYFPSHLFIGLGICEKPDASGTGHPRMFIHGPISPYQPTLPATQIENVTTCNIYYCGMT